MPNKWSAIEPALFPPWEDMGRRRILEAPTLQGTNPAQWMPPWSVTGQMENRWGITIAFLAHAVSKLQSDQIKKLIKIMEGFSLLSRGCKKTGMDKFKLEGERLSRLRSKKRKEEKSLNRLTIYQHYRLSYPNWERAIGSSFPRTVHSCMQISMFLVEHPSLLPHVGSLTWGPNFFSRMYIVKDELK